MGRKKQLDATVYCASYIALTIEDVKLVITRKERNDHKRSKEKSLSFAIKKEC